MTSRATTPDPSRDQRERYSANGSRTRATYLITFTCYGTRVHGDESWSVDRKHNVANTPMLDAYFGRLFYERTLMDQRAYLMDHLRRNAVLEAIIERCRQRDWDLLAAHIRSNHVHLILAADTTPERIMNDIKSCASRSLNQLGFDTPERKRWARHGSTRHLYGRKNTDAAIRYVVESQGTPMAVYRAEDLRCPER